MNLTEKQFENWAASKISRQQEEEERDCELEICAGGRLDRATLQIYDAVCQMMPITDGRDELANLERMTIRADRHAALLRMALDRDQEEMATTRFFDQCAYILFCTEIGAKLGVPGAQEFMDRLMDSAETGEECL